MPSIEWQHNGNFARCDSSDPVIIARWILEQVRKASPGHTTIKIYPMLVPTGVGGRPVVDWGGGVFTEGADQNGLNRLAQYIMAWQAERTAPIVVEPSPFTEETTTDER
jgi:hypothetical protein